MTNPVLPPSKYGAGHTVGASNSGAAPRPGAAPGNDVSFPAPSQPMAASPAAVDPSAGIATASVNPLAVVAFALTVLLGPFLVVVALPMAVVARTQIRRLQQGGMLLANAAIAIAIAYSAIGITALVLFVVYPPTAAVR